jgi:hypothetical protein
MDGNGYRSWMMFSLPFSVWFEIVTSSSLGVGDDESEK